MTLIGQTASGYHDRVLAKPLQGAAAVVLLNENNAAATISTTAAAAGLPAAFSPGGAALACTVTYSTQSQ